MAIVLLQKQFNITKGFHSNHDMIKKSDEQGLVLHLDNIHLIDIKLEILFIYYTKQAVACVVTKF